MVGFQGNLLWPAVEQMPESTMHQHLVQMDLQEGQNKRGTDCRWIWAGLAYSLAGKGQWHNFCFIICQLTFSCGSSMTGAAPSEQLQSQTACSSRTYPGIEGSGYLGDCLKRTPSTSMAFVPSLKLPPQEGVAAWGSYLMSVFCIFLQSPLRIPFILGKKPPKATGVSWWKRFYKIQPLSVCCCKLIAKPSVLAAIPYLLIDHNCLKKNTASLPVFLEHHLWFQFSKIGVSWLSS